VLAANYITNAFDCLCGGHIFSGQSSGRGGTKTVQVVGHGWVGWVDDKIIYLRSPNRSCYCNG
jgi:hypothetical protein